jgi:hypothetical protein
MKGPQAVPRGSNRSLGGLSISRSRRSHLVARSARTRCPRGTGVKATAHRRLATSAWRSNPLAAGAHFANRRLDPTPSWKVRPPRLFCQTVLRCCRGLRRRMAAGTSTSSGGGPASSILTFSSRRAPDHLGGGSAPWSAPSSRRTSAAMPGSHPSRWCRGPPQTQRVALAVSRAAEDVRVGMPDLHLVTAVCIRGAAKRGGQIGRRTVGRWRRCAHRLGRRVVTSWTNQLLPSGSRNETNEP